MTVLIPALEPDDRLLGLTAALTRRGGLRVIVVDDGSGSRYAPVFSAARRQGCVVLTHERNRGKGCALKTGFAYILAQTDEKTGVVTADADGQHTMADILRVAEEIPGAPGRVVLGVRRFTGKVPLRSALGNGFSRIIFTAASGCLIRDTQSGLRGIPVSLLPQMLRIGGDRFEYEMEMLLEAGTLGYGFRQIDIETVYIAGNRSSHFRPVIDSLRVCLPFFRFCLTGIASAAVDYFLLFVFQWLIGTVWGLPGALFFGVVLARAVSSGVNFALNRTLVFRSKAEIRKTGGRASRYYLLAAGLLMVNYLLLKLFSEVFHIWLPLAKVLVELLLFFASYFVQRFLLFKKKPAADAPAPDPTR